MNKIFKGFILVLLLALVGLCITYIVQPSIFDGWFGLAEEQPVDEPPTEDTEQPGTDTEESNDNSVAVASASEFSFDGSAVTGYFGDDIEIVIPTSYSYGEIKSIEKTFMSFPDFYYYIARRHIIYPITLNYNNEDHVYDSCDAYRPDLIAIKEAKSITLKCNEQTYIDGNDIKVDTLQFNLVIDNLKSSVKSVIVPEGIENVQPFSLFPNMEKVAFPSTINNLADDLFAFSDKLKEIIVDENNINYVDEDGILFNKDKTSLIVYPQGRVEETYVVPSSVTIIGSWAFFKCKNITNIDFSRCLNLTIIEDSAFSCCYNLKSIEFPLTLTTIGDYAFAECYSLTSITFPSSVKSICDSAFSFCSNLRKLILVNSIPPVIGFTPFDNLFTSDLLIFVPEDSVEAYKIAWPEYADIIVPNSTMSI